jgi:S1-C subfamily serine protease
MQIKKSEIMSGSRIIVETLIEQGSMEGIQSPLVSPRPFLGITATALKKGDQYAQDMYAPCDAVYVVSVQKNGAANGILEVGDLILTVDGRSATDLNVLLNLLNQYDIGDRVTLKIIRNGEEMKVSITLKTYTAE